VIDVKTLCCGLWNADFHDFYDGHDMFLMVRQNPDYDPRVAPGAMIVKPLRGSVYSNYNFLVVWQNPEMHAFQCSTPSGLVCIFVINPGPHSGYVVIYPGLHVGL